MVVKGGYTGRILMVDLGKSECKTIDWTSEKSEWLKFVGGRGFGAKIIWEQTGRSTEPLGPDNVLVFAAGPLTGLPVPGPRISVCSLSPLTGIWGDSAIGGYAGLRMKQCGYDAVVLKGRRKGFVYLYVGENEVEVRDASHLVGMGSIEAQEALREELGGDVAALTIGPAGENLVLFACITSDYGRQAGRTGMGAVMGSKGVKAVVFDGSLDVPVADADRLVSLLEEAREYIMKSNPELYAQFSRYGTTMTLDWAQDVACLPTRNFSENVFEDAEMIGANAVEEKIMRGKRGCFACPIACRTVSEVKVNGKTVHLDGPEYETLALLGSNLGLGDIEALSAAHYLCDHYGLDAISAGAVIGFAIECAQRGLMSLDGLKAEWGNKETIFKLLESIAYRRGIGGLLAEGVRRLAEFVGNGCEEYAMHVKGLEQSGYETRAAPGMSLAYGTCDVGAHHNRSTIIGWESRNDRLGVGRDKVEVQILLQHQRSLFDALGVCRFPWCETKLPFEYYPMFYQAATGIQAGEDELLTASERIFNLTRMISVRRGVSRKDDYPPRRVFNEPLPSGPFKGVKVDIKDYDGMLDVYYSLRGWDNNGIPTREKLEELGILDMIEKGMG
ncbi:MAG: aldehyde ferredoxin oxidoreductase family protein [Candidatus Freyarchaeota archaeon]|nr:aldehyde ferredoxin oxidoreductase family protein [Candidatus Freyrarchaeum guaymaensis]